MGKLLAYAFMSLVGILSVISLVVTVVFILVWIILKTEKNRLLDNYSCRLSPNGRLTGWFGSMTSFMYELAYLRLPDRPLKKFLIHYQPIYDFIYNRLFSYALISFFVVCILMIISIVFKEKFV
ncbi:hypothetical protein K6689_004255 [Vibrio parahaemolyticus]|nr:hypothetical protein [Vibrio parahaemolyticus]